MSRPSLETVLAGYSSALVAFSGGVDSALVAVMARRVLGPRRAVAGLGVSPSLARAQQEQARDLARRFDLTLIEVPTDEVADPDYARNAPNRCYFCKRELWRRLAAVAAERRMAVVADGSNLDDLGDHRPGARAARERDIRSPLIEAGLTKAAVREAARRLDIPIWNAPAAPCLASRVTYGLGVTPERLAQVEAAETSVRALGVTGDLRVRHRGPEARIEVGPDLFPLLRARRTDLGRALLPLGFTRVTLDLAGYRRGSLLGREAEVELLAGEA